MSTDVIRRHWIRLQKRWIVNQHHMLYYHHAADTLDKLHVFVEGRYDLYRGSMDHAGRCENGTEWISRIQEQLSVSYAGLGMKYASDYNRNIYLDILNYTRRDKELESRYLSWKPIHDK